MPKVCAVIMAGGVGTRFWPWSREKSAKQFLEIVGKSTMIQNTVRRLEGYVALQDTYVVTNKLQKALVARQLPSLPEENIIGTPMVVYWSWDPGIRFFSDPLGKLLTIRPGRIGNLIR